MEELSDYQILKYAYENGILNVNINAIQSRIEMNERKKYLDAHTSQIWQGSDGKWRTYVVNNQGKRKMLCKKERKHLEDDIVELYKSLSDEPTLRRVFYMWAQEKLQYGEVQKQTYDRYEYDLLRFFKNSKLLDTKIGYITEENLEEFIRDTIHNQQLSSKAWGNLRTILNGIFKYARKKHYSKIVISSFMSELELSKRIFTRKYKEDSDNVFTEQELTKIINYIKNSPNTKLSHLGILLGLYTGMRVGEIVALKHEDIFEDYIYVHRTQIKYKGPDGKMIHEVRDSTKTDAGVRKVIMTKKTKSIVNQIRLKTFGNEYLLSKNGKPITIHALIYALYGICDKVGIKRRSMHVLRKTYATRLINAGVDEAIIINQMGHTNFDTTRQYYYYNDKTLNVIAEKIQNAIGF